MSSIFCLLRLSVAVKLHPNNRPAFVTVNITTATIIYEQQSVISIFGIVLKHFIHAITNSKRALREHDMNSKRGQNKHKH